MEASAAATAVPWTWPRVSIVNDPSSGVDDATVEKWTEAMADDILKVFGPIWHIGAHFEFVPVGHKPSAGAWVIVLLDSSDVAGALGYHDLTPEGLPLGKAFLGTDRQFGANPMVTIDHELKEMLADPWICLSAQDNAGKFWAWESCDAVEADELGYPGLNGFTHSAFVGPGWFGSGDPSAICYPQGRVTRPLELAAGGYMSVFDPSSGQGWTQVQAQSAKTGPAADAERLAAIPRVGSRRERRFRGRENWVLSTYEVG